MTLKELRKEKHLSQKDAAKMIGIPYRTYCRYEDDSNYEKTYKYKKIFNDLFEITKIDESHGVLNVEDIKTKVVPILQNHSIKYCYLFGSYSRGKAKETSDVDLLVDTAMTGIDFFMLVEELRKALIKKVDLIRLNDLQAKNPLALEILKEGIRLL